MTTETQQKRPTTLAELGMRFTQDEMCQDCKSGKCHNWSTGKSKDCNGNEIEWFIHVSVESTFCDPECKYQKFIISVQLNNTTDSPEDYELEASLEIDCVNFLVNNFHGFRCSEHS